MFGRPDSFIPDSRHSTGFVIVPDGERIMVDKAVLLGDYMAWASEGACVGKTEYVTGVSVQGKIPGRA